MASKQSSGTLLYRVRDGAISVLLVHASGWYNKKAPWGIPKGLIDAGEDPEQAARRETLEETGIVAGELSPIGHIDYKKSNKRIFAFAGPLPSDAEPTCASWEIDAAEIVELDRARQLIHPDQAVFIDRLLDRLEASPALDNG